MTGIEKLRALAHKKNFLEPAEARELDAIADQIEREQGGRVSRMRVLSVVTEMERHVLGAEGMGDSPVARWARELREALGGNGRDPAADVSVSAYDLLPQEDREAIAWVRDHGGLDYVKSEWRSRVPYDRYERRRQRLLGHIAECETALGRRREIISELNHRASDLTRENAELRKRAMPEGFEWPTYESGEPVMLGDSVTEYVAGGELKVRSVEFRDGATYLREGFRTDGIVIVRPGERVKRPAPKVLASDGEPLKVGQTVWETDAEADTPQTVVEVSSDLVRCEYTWKDGKTYRPCYPPYQLTHQRPDTWQRIEEDAKKRPCHYFGHERNTCDGCPAHSVYGSCRPVMTSDLVRRCRALAERERGE